MGVQFMRRRKSALIDGAADDARELAAHIAQLLARRQHHPDMERTGT
jgi:putative flavoprotein involved in K+ transport